MQKINIQSYTTRPQEFTGPRLCIPKCKGDREGRVRKYSLTTETREFPNAVALNAVGRRSTQRAQMAQTQVRKRAQKGAKERKRVQKSAKGCKRAQKGAKQRKICKQPCRFETNWFGNSKKLFKTRGSELHFLRDRY